jgi:hypothetical protein
VIKLNQVQFGFFTEREGGGNLPLFLNIQVYLFVNILESKNTYMDPDTVVWSVNIMLGIGMIGVAWMIYKILKEAQDELS